jgi:RNA polymerase sigma-70 factor (ECF subfamily)
MSTGRSSSSSEDDKRLARRMARGEEQAFAQFVDAYGGRVYRLVRRYIACEADAEDVTQEIFVDVCGASPIFGARRRCQRGCTALR